MKQKKETSLFKKLFIRLIIILLIGFVYIIFSTLRIKSSKILINKSMTTIYDLKGRKITNISKNGGIREIQKIKNIPKHTQDAFIAIEDKRFYKHFGFDIFGITRAFFKMILRQDTQGASTITQQTIKNTIFDFMQEKTFLDKFSRKIKELIFSIKVERSLSKKQILESYLNTINLGHGTFGIKEAANCYFNKDPIDLTISESAVIAGIAQNPTRYDPIINPKNNAARRKIVLSYMLEQNLISKKQYKQALNDNVYLRIKKLNNINKTRYLNNPNYYYIDALKKQIIKELQEKKGFTKKEAIKYLYFGNLKIISPLDKNIQKICSDEINNEKNYPKNTLYKLQYSLIINKNNKSIIYSANDIAKSLKNKKNKYNHLGLYNSKQQALNDINLFKAKKLKKGVIYSETFNLIPQPQISFVLMDYKHGYVKALVGGRGINNVYGSLNRAISSIRQPGSCFKILSTYLPAIDSEAYDLCTKINDNPYTYKNGKPIKNWNNKYSGIVSLRTAIEQSINICAVKTITDITPNLAFNYLKRFEFKHLSNHDKVQSLALGGITHGVTNLEMTAAFSSIANKGTYIKPIFYTKVLDENNKVILKNKKISKRICQKSTAELITEAMIGVTTKGTGRTCNIGEIPVSGKTGTTSNSIDLWFCGYTPYYTASIWYGYDNNELIDHLNGVYHKLIWANIMKKIHKNFKVKKFKYKHIKKVSLCVLTNKLASSYCKSKTEYFPKENIPHSYCNSCHLKKEEKREDEEEVKQKKEREEEIEEIEEEIND